MLLSSVREKTEKQVLELNEFGAAAVAIGESQ